MKKVKNIFLRSLSITLAMLILLILPADMYAAAEATEIRVTVSDDDPFSTELANTVANAIDGAVGRGEVITEVIFDEGVLTVLVDLSNKVSNSQAAIPEDQLALSRAGSITDEILTLDEKYLEHIVTVCVDFGAAGYVECQMSEAVDSPYGKYFVIRNLLPPETKNMPDSPDGVITSSITKRINDMYSGTEIVSITVNPDLGTAEDGDYTALVRLTWNVKNTGKASRSMLKMYSDDLAVWVYENDPDVQEIAVFWNVPYLSADAKCSYERRSDGMYITDTMWGAAFG